MMRQHTEPILLHYYAKKQKNRIVLFEGYWGK